MALLSEGGRKWLKWLGYPAFAILSLAYMIHLTFPYQRLEPFAKKALGEGFDLDVGSIGPGWFPGDVVIKDATLTSHPKREGEKPVVFNIDRLDVDVAVWAALGKDYKADLEARVGEGVIDASFAATGSELHIEARSEDLPLADIPGVSSATGGVPLEGGLTLTMDVTAPVKKQPDGAPARREYTWREANGNIELACNGCTVGDGKTAAHSNAPGSSATGGGLTLPRLRLGTFSGRIDINKGQGRLLRFGGKSPDGEVIIDGKITFDDPFSRSDVLGYMRFKADESLAQRDEKMKDMLTVSRGTSLRPDGYMGVKIWGPINGLRFGGSKISPPDLNLDDKTVSTGPAPHGVKPVRPGRDPGVGVPPNAPLTQPPEGSTPPPPSGPPDAGTPSGPPDAAPPPPPPPQPEVAPPQPEPAPQPQPQPQID